MTKPREISPNGIYHVVIRGNNKNDVFCDDEDNLKFLYILEDIIATNNVEIYAYCLMINHAHIMLRVNKNSISEIMSSDMLRYVKWYNKKYERTGHLFQDRFFSNPVTSAKYFLAGLQYIYNNPVKAGLCDSPLDYKWSSFRQLYMHVPGLPVLTPSLNRFPLNQQLLSIMDSEIDLHTWEHKDTIFDTEAIEIIKATLNLTEWKEIQNLSLPEIKQCVDILAKRGSSKRQIARLLGITRRNVKKFLPA